MNRKVADMYGYEPEEAKGLSIGAKSADAPPFGSEDALERISRAAAGSPQVFDLWV